MNNPRWQMSSTSEVASRANFDTVPFVGTRTPVIDMNPIVVFKGQCSVELQHFLAASVASLEAADRELLENRLFFVSSGDAINSIDQISEWHTMVLTDPSSMATALSAQKRWGHRLVLLANANASPHLGGPSFIEMHEPDLPVRAAALMAPGVDAAEVSRLMSRYKDNYLELREACLLS